MMFADAEPLTWKAALTVIVSAAVIALANWLTSRGQKKAAKEGAKEAVEPVLKVAQETYASVNGAGLTGAVARVEGKVDGIADEQKSHAASDDRRFTRIEQYLGMPDRPAGG